jgi:hypothetical protein
MKILGFQLDSYGQIKSQFIPYRKSLSLLVGKNNSGKSATLLFLHHKEGAGMAPYANSGSAPQFRVVAAFEPNDICPVLNLKGGTQTLIDQGALVKFSADLAKKAFGAGHLFWGKIQNSIVFANEGNAINLTSYGTDGTIHYRNTQMINPAELVPGFSEAITTRYIAPHRQILPSSDMTAVNEVPQDGGRLGAYLQTIIGSGEDTFERINKAFCAIFPEFRKIILKPEGNQVRVQLRPKSGGNDHDIKSCGAGLEQCLILLSVIYENPKGILLIDEPHNFLHPSAERQLAHVLMESGREIIASTHSPVLINAVQGEQIILLSPPGDSYDDYVSRKPNDHNALLHLAHAAVGFKNSDVLFHDYLVFVEGDSDAEILPLLLKGIGVDVSIVDNIGFPRLNGVAKLNNPDKVVRLLQLYEDLLSSVGRAAQEHIYFFDQDRDFFRDTATRANREAPKLSIRFTAGQELENVFLDAKLIAKALKEDAALYSVDAEINEELVSLALSELLNCSAEDELFTKLYPAGTSKESRLDSVKGSALLEELWSKFTLVYEKRASGKRLAAHIDCIGVDSVKRTISPILDLIGVNPTEFGNMS